MDMYVQCVDVKVHSPCHCAHALLGCSKGYPCGPKASHRQLESWPVKQALANIRTVYGQPECA